MIGATTKRNGVQHHIQWALPSNGQPTNVAMCSHVVIPSVCLQRSFGLQPVCLTRDAFWITFGFSPTIRLSMPMNAPTLLATDHNSTTRSAANSPTNCWKPQSAFDERAGSPRLHPCSLVRHAADSGPGQSCIPGSPSHSKWRGTCAIDLPYINTVRHVQYVQHAVQYNTVQYTKDDCFNLWVCKLLLVA